MRSFQHVDAEFLKHFLEGDTSCLEKTFKNYKGEPFTAYFKVGNQGEVAQENREKYPSITIVYFTPEERPGFEPDNKPYYASHRDTNNDDILDTCTRYYDPIAFNCRYEIDIATKDKLQHLALTQWFSKRFLRGLSSKYLALDSGYEAGTPWGTDSGTETVEYAARKMADPERSDGVQQTIYEIILRPFIHIVEPEDVPLIEDVNFRIPQ
jgi:hypothetical protein